MKPKRAPAKKKSAGGTLIGLFIGLVLGIVGAAAVVWYINKMPTPFNKQATPPQGANGAAAKSSESGKAQPSGAQQQAGTPAPLPGKPGDPVP